MSDTQAKQNNPPKAMRPRPLSPHLQVYRLPLAALTSITHRATGVALTAGAFVLVAWLYAAASNAEYFKWWQAAFATPMGLVCVAGWSFALFYHLCTGIRHLVWDAGAGFSKGAVSLSNILVIAGALGLTAAAWFLALPKLPFTL
jgi:succinate dehydrogenase / fumarate reductase, cytochrome b subunit